MSDMTNADAAAIIHKIGNCPLPDEAYCALQMAEEALTAPGWIRTADRLPTEADALDGMVVNAWAYGESQELCGLMVVPFTELVETAEIHDYWLSLPALPEVDNG